MNQINGIYDVSYFASENNEYPTSDDKIWWSSKARYAPSTEYVEIDLSKRRSINYISFDAIQKPVDIEIQYDSIDLDNLDDYSNDPRWRTVKRLDGSVFDSSIDYVSNQSNPWKHCEFYFTDDNGDTLTTKRLRIKFTRRSDQWPTENFSQFAWTIDVKNLRVGRYATEESHTVNSIISINSFSGTRSFPSEVRQRFQMSEDYVLISEPTANLSNIDSFSPSNIVPKIMGFEVLVKPEEINSVVSLDWQLLRIDAGVETTLDRGTVEKTITASTVIPNPQEENYNVPEHEWIRVNLNRTISTTANGKYEIRLRNANPKSVKNFYVSSPNIIPFVSGSEYDLVLVNTLGDATTQNNECLVMRVLADIGNYGKDLLGNEYREGVRYNSAIHATDEKIYTNWTCKPNPSQDGVEALYFDVRTLSSGKYSPSVIDALEINTLTPGVRMNVYFSNQQLTSAPQSIDDWEDMMWTPVRNSFRLSQKQTIDLPYPVSANWICLEFYNLQATPLGLSNYPILPAVSYKEFPQWVYSDNPKKTETNDEAILQKETFVGYTIPEVFSPVLENKNDTVRVYSDTAQTLEQAISENGFGSADPIILSSVSFSKNPFVTPSVKRVDTSSMLGEFVHQNYTNNIDVPYIAEAPQYPRVVESRNVSNANDRRMLARYEESDLLFNRVCAHRYAVKTGRYNKKAYTVSVSEVLFLRKDYSVEFDDQVIHDVLVYENIDQSLLIESSSWEPEQKISIPIGSSVFVTYTINGVEYEDERVIFESPASDSASFEPVDLSVSGGIATSVIARSQAFKAGETYYRDQDFVIVYDPVGKKNQIKRNDIPARLVVPNVVNSIDRYTVSGAAIINTEVDTPLTDQIELGALSGVALSQGVSSVVGAVTPPTSGASFGATTIYATLTDPTD